MPFAILNTLPLLEVIVWPSISIVMDLATVIPFANVSSSLANFVTSHVTLILEAQLLIKVCKSAKEVGA